MLSIAVTQEPMAKIQYNLFKQGDWCKQPINVCGLISLGLGDMSCDTDVRMNKPHWTTIVKVTKPKTAELLPTPLTIETSSA